MTAVNTILCVEDDSNLRQLICEELLSAGYRVLEAVDGHEALALMATDIPDLVLSDVSMPGMGGFELIEEMVLRGGKLAHLPFILLTALADSQHQVRGRQLGVDDYLIKPVDFDLLLAAIGAKLKGRRGSQQLPLQDKRLHHRENLLALLEGGRDKQISQNLLLVKVDSYLALSMRLAPGDLQTLQQRMQECLMPLSSAAMVCGWSAGYWALLLPEDMTNQAASVLSNRMLLDISGVAAGYTCSALCVHIDWRSARLRHFTPLALVEACALHLGFESVSSPRRFIELGIDDYAALEAAQHAERYLAEAIKSGELELVFQPRVELGSGRIVGAEALLRWPHARIGALAPGMFVPTAERLGLAIELDHWVISQTLDAVAKLAQRQPAFILSFNVSAQSLGRGMPSFLKTQLLSGAGRFAANLEIEITETSMAHLTADIEAEIAALRALGLKLAVDDFGMGYASLAYLKRLHAEVIKIDRNFVTDLPHRTIDQRIVESVVSMGHALDCTVVAEGVENAQQAQALQALGCRYAQGFYFYHPMSLACLLALLEET